MGMSDLDGGQDALGSAHASTGEATPPQAPAGPWPETPWSLIRRARAGEAADARTALESLLALYYLPVRRFFSRVLRLSEDAAGDVAHDLFAKLLERRFVEGLSHETSFRGFLKLACRRRTALHREAEAARRRALIALSQEPPEGADDDALDEEIRRFTIEEATRRVREALLAQGKGDVFRVFEARARPDGSRPEDYATLAARFGKRVYDIRNHLTAARRIFRRELMRIAAERTEDPREDLRELGLLRFVEG